MPPDPLTDEDEQYASSEDSDFAPDDAPAAASNHSDSEDDAEQPSKKRRPAADADAEDAGYDNSGDEAIIKRGKRRKTKTKDQIANEDDEGGEGGLIKTRRQRAAEYALSDVDSVMNDAHCNIGKKRSGILPTQNLSLSMSTRYGLRCWRASLRPRQKSLPKMALTTRLRNSQSTRTPWLQKLTTMHPL